MTTPEKAAEIAAGLSEAGTKRLSICDRRAIRRRASTRSATICRRLADESLWAASSPQNFGLAMAGMFSGKSGWHFCKARQWRGVWLIDPKVFWSFNQNGLFRIVEQDVQTHWLPQWPESIETAKIRTAEDLMKGEEG